MKRIQGQDPELVLGVLEGCLRSLSNEVVRRGTQITLLGLGPSPRAVNPRDTTVIHVKREDGAAVIHADVRFQASAFLGMAAQDMVVKEKLDRIFDEMLTQLGLTGWTTQSEKVDGAAAAAVGVERPANSAEPAIVTLEAPAKPQSSEHVAWEAARNDQPAANAMPELAAESGNDTEPTPSAVQLDIPAAETVAASEPIRGNPVPEQIVPVPAAESMASPEIAGNDSKEPVAVLGGKLPEVSGAVPGVKQPDAVERSAAADSDSGENVDAPKLDAAAEIGAVFTDASKAVQGNEEALAESADPAPIPPVESAKPLSTIVAAPAIESDQSAERSKKGAEENRLGRFVKQTEAVTLNALRAGSSSQDVSSAIRSPKPTTRPTAPVAKAPPLPVLPEPAKGMFSASRLSAADLEDEPETGSKWLKWSAWLAAFIVLVVAPLVWLYMPSHPESAAPVSQPALAAAPAPQPSILVKQAGDDPDPAMVVSDWEAAMNSRDAAAQAAFYADPVERYFLRHNLSRDEVKADKQSAINRRKDGWSVEMENVKITRAGDNSAKARLIKHYTVKEDGKMASEWFVPSLLMMKRANGRWQITSERDLGWATSLDELGY